ncbi:MAG: hypothetical protein Q4Q03_03520, partial [Bowdeniella nasicola]|nr:hypothetical protein [Bowdeniella nasicola]
MYPDGVIFRDPLTYQVKVMDGSLSEELYTFDIPGEALRIYEDAGLHLYVSFADAISGLSEMASLADQQSYLIGASGALKA